MYFYILIVMSEFLTTWSPLNQTNVTWKRCIKCLPRVFVLCFIIFQVTPKFWQLKKSQRSKKLWNLRTLPQDPGSYSCAMAVSGNVNKHFTILRQMWAEQTNSSKTPTATRTPQRFQTLSYKACMHAGENSYKLYQNLYS